MDGRARPSLTINALVGVWLFVAAFLFTHPTAMFWNMIILGIALFAINMARSERYSNAGHGINLVIGAWLILSPFVLPVATTFTYYNLVISGALVIVSSLYGVGSTQRLEEPVQ